MDRNFVFTITTALSCLPLVKSLCNDPNCAVCNYGGNTCDKCEKGFTLKNNNCTPCPTNCLTCTADGYCQSCSLGFWGIQCLYTCPNNCNNAGCEMTSANCLGCDAGWYGPQCQQECDRCENEQCDLIKCSTGCKDGYVQQIYNDISNCIQCPLFCKKCSNASFCTQCNSGHYVYQYTSTAGIVASCLNCSAQVPNCADCTIDQNQVFCRSCEAGYVVNQYNQCVRTKPCIDCQNGCDSEGRCFGGCQPGWTGTMCNYKCSFIECETCSNQDACLSCRDGFYTQRCTVPCNTNCQSGNYPRCRFGDGYCSNGCNKGFWGDQCENNCNNNCLDITTALELCHRNGTCYYGCKEGYMGSDCSQFFSTSPTILTSTYKRTASTTETKPDVNANEAYLHTVSDYRVSLGPAIGGSIAGVFVLGGLAAAVVFYLRKRILQKQRARTQSENMYYNVSMSASHEEQSQSDTDRHPDRNDIELASASRQCETTLYEKLSEQNIGNLYDHLEQPSENEIMQEVGELGSNGEYYNT